MGMQRQRSVSARRVGIFAVLVLILPLTAVMIARSGDKTMTATLLQEPTIDDGGWLLTESAIVGNVAERATGTEQASINATATAVNLACDPAAVFATQTAVAQSSTPTPLLPTPDALMQTATAVRANATRTEWARRAGASLPLPPTPQPLAGLDPLMMTATAVRVYATYTAYAVNVSLTPLPSFTAEILATLRAEWIAELETALGFSHPILEAFGDDLVQDACHTLALNSPHLIWGFETNPFVQRLTIEDTSYIAIIANSGFAWNMQRLLLFRVTGEQLVLLFDSSTSSDFNFLISFNSLSYGQNWRGGFGDRNGNTYPDLVVDTGSGGNSSSRELVILEIYPDDRVENITPRVADPLYASYLVDLDSDDVFEIEVLGCISHPESLYCDYGGVNFYRYYRWDSTTYVDITHTLSESDYPEIAHFFRFARRNTGCLLPSDAMYQMLLAYHALGRLEEGWARLQPFLRWELCSADVIRDYGPDMIELENWVEALLAE